MKRICLAVMLIVLASSVGVGQKKKSRRTTRPVATPKLTNPAQAKIEAAKAWDALVTKCGDSFYSFIGSQLSEFRFVSITVEEHRLSEADKLNQIEWEGRTYFNTRAWRTYWTNSRPEHWTEWTTIPFRPSLHMTKKAGTWRVGEPSNGMRGFTCSLIPPG